MFPLLWRVYGPKLSLGIKLGLRLLFSVLLMVYSRESLLFLICGVIGLLLILRAI